GGINEILNDPMLARFTGPRTTDVRCISRGGSEEYVSSGYPPHSGSQARRPGGSALISALPGAPAPQRIQKPIEMTYTALPSVRDSQMDGQSSVKSSQYWEPLFPFLDLKAQFDDIKNEVMEAVSHVFEDQRFILGPEVELLENEIAALVGARAAVGFASGSDALLLSLKALGIGPGDEVITTPFTF